MSRAARCLGGLRPASRVVLRPRASAVDNVHVARGCASWVAEAEAPRGARVAYLPMAENDRAIAVGQTAGFIKLIAAPRRFLRNAGGGRIVGATIVAERGGEMIHEPALLMRTNGFTGRLAQLTHAYPTWSSASRSVRASSSKRSGPTARRYG